MVAAILHEAGLDPTVVIGGKVNSFDSNARLGYGEVFVAEADESDGSFLVLSPTHAIITNIDAEHMDHYGSFDRVLDAFVGFANRVPFYGMTAICLDDPNVRSIQPRLTKRTVSYAIAHPDADYRATDINGANGRSSFRVLAHGEDRGRFEVAMPGRHNILNALASIALCDEQGVSTAVSRKALAEFTGVQRRFTIRGIVRDTVVVDDYGHHPTELRATLAAARETYPERRIVAVFQPHRFTRVRNHFDDFVASLDAADLVVLTPIYAAGEAPIPGIDSDALARGMRARVSGREVLLVEGADVVLATTQLLREQARPGDVVITLGAGSITRVSFALVEVLGG
jgi:UDP-N-acetylmuramate--alanine ligase